MNFSIESYGYDGELRLECKRPGCPAPVVLPRRDPETGRAHRLWEIPLDGALAAAAQHDAEHHLDADVDVDAATEFYNRAATNAASQI